MCWRTLGISIVFLSVAASVQIRAEIYRWDNHQLIPGTEGITPGPGIDLFGRHLAFADLALLDLNGSIFHSADLTDASLQGSNLYAVEFASSTLRGTDISGAMVNGASFTHTTDGGFVQQQLYSTKSYQEKSLRGIILFSNDLSGWDFTGQDLTDARFATRVALGNYASSELEGTDFSASNLTNADLGAANLRDALFAGAIIERINLHRATGFTKEQLYVTQSYLDNRLNGISLAELDLTDWDFHGKDLTNANLGSTTLTGANLTDAVVNGSSLSQSALTSEQLYSTASYRAKNLQGIDLSLNFMSGWDFSNQQIRGVGLEYATGGGFTKSQLYSTASYQAKDLRGIRLGHNDLTGWDFAGQDLTGANFSDSLLTNTVFAQSIVTGVGFSSTSRGFTKKQIQSTASFQKKDLRGIVLTVDSDQTDWDFSGQNLSGARLDFSSALLLNFSGADLSLATLSGSALKGGVFTAASLQGAYVSGDLTNAVMVGVDASSATFVGSLIGANLSNADLTKANLHAADLTGADLMNARIVGANLGSTTLRGGLTKHQLYSTASYQSHVLTGVGLNSNNLQGWDFSNQDLTGAQLWDSSLNGANFSDTTITAAELGGTDLAKEQLYSTKSYKSRDLRRLGLFRLNLAGWNFTHQFLAGSNFNTSVLADADFSGADLRGASADLSGAKTTNLIHADGTVVGLNLSGGESLWIRDYDGEFVYPELDTPTIVDVRSSFTMQDGGALILVFNADPWDSLISFEPDIPVQLGGTLELTFTDDTQLATQSGRTIKVFDWTGVSPTGQFQVASPYTWELTNLYKTGEVTFLSHILGDCTGDSMLSADDLSCVATLDVGDAVLDALRTLPGDLDGNKQIDLADFLVLSGNFDNEIGTYSEGNVDLVGGVAFADFLILADNFGKSLESQAVPEPSGVGLAFAAIAGLTICYRRRKLN